MTLQHNSPPNTTDVQGIAKWAFEEFQRLEQALNFGREFFMLKELHAPPVRLKLGMIALADGTDWNPGSGAGVYAYYGAAWHKLG
jgi:hypothetical protein